MRVFTFILLFGLLSCSKTREDQYVGDLCFRTLFRLGSFYNEPDSVIKRINSILDTVDINDNAPDQPWIRMYLSLKEQNMLYKPTIDLQQKDGESLVTLVLDSVDYEQFKNYNWKDLRANNKKVMVWAKTRTLKQFGQIRLLYCTDVVDIKVVEGETYPAGRQKFKVYDYE